MKSEHVMLPYDGADPVIGWVASIYPATITDVGVSTYIARDLDAIVVIAERPDGIMKLPLLITRDGWLPLRDTGVTDDEGLDEELEADREVFEVTDDITGEAIPCDYTVDEIVQYTLRLSPADRQLIARAVLRHFGLGGAEEAD